MQISKTLENRLSAYPVASAVILMVISAGFFSGQHGVVRYLYLSADIHPLEMVFFRNLFGFAIFIPWLVTNGFGAMATQRFGTHVVRACANMGSLMAYFTALSLVPLADATALFLSVPLFVCLGAVLFLGERLGRARWIALAFGVAGALVIIRPGFEAIGAGTSLVIIAATFAASTRLLAKSLSRTDSPPAIVAYVTLIMTPVTLVPAAFVWTSPNLWELAWLVAIGVFGSLGQLSAVKAYTLVDVSFAEPMVFTRLLWAALIGYFVFAEIPGLWTWIGGALIVIATTIIARQRLS